jgi:signal transduction histidine kinase
VTPTGPPRRPPRPRVFPRKPGARDGKLGPGTLGTIWGAPALLYELGLLATFSVSLWVAIDLAGARGPLARRLPFAGLVGTCAVFAVGTLAFERAATPEQVLAARRILYLGVVTLGVAWLWCGAVTARADWLRRAPGLVALAALPALFFYSFLWWDRTGLFMDWGAVPARRGPVFWLHLAYSWILVAAGTVYFLAAAARLRKAHPLRIGAIVLAAAAPLVVNLLYLASDLPHDPTPILLGASAVVVRLAVLDSGLADLLPMGQRSVLDQIRTGVVVADLDGVVIDANEAARRLLRADSLAGRRVADLAEIARADAARVIEVERVPLRSRLGEVGSVALFSDRTEAASMERQLREAQRFESLGVLAGGIAHDFNNLLGAIIGNASVAKSELRDHPARRPIESAIQTAKLASALTHQLLAYAGKGSFKIKPLDLSAEIRELRNLLRSAIPRAVQLDFELGAGLPTIQADPIEMAQVLMNLTRNGADAIAARAGGRGTVRVVTYAAEIRPADCAALVPGHRVAPGEHVVLEVRDDGCGMDEETRRRVFEPFFTTKADGRGLGLAATLGIVHGHGGGIAVESAPGRGTTFRVYLPPAKRDRPAERPSAAA